MTFDLQPLLKNELVILTPLEEKDRNGLYVVAADPLIWEQHQEKDRFTRTVFDTFFKESLFSGGALTIREKKSFEVIGSSRYNILNAPDSIEIGWSFLARRYWGGQYNRAIKELMINHALRFVEDIIFYVDKNNFRSQKAVLKLGAKIIRDTRLVRIYAKSETDIIFMLNKEMWQHPWQTRTENERD